MAGADLTPFVTQALAVGAQAIASAGGTQDTFHLEALVADVGTRTTEAAAKAAGATDAAVSKAAAALEQVSTAAQRVITEAGATARQHFGDNVDAAKKALTAEVQRLFAGENAEVLTRLTPLLDGFGRDLDERVAKRTAELIAGAARQFDPADPTSPMARHSAEQKASQQQLSETLQRSFDVLGGKVEHLATAVAVARAAQESAARTAQRTPLKGETYAQAVHQAMGEIAVGLGDVYTDTGAKPGAIAHCKKGDSVLSIEGTATALVLEMSDSPEKRDWAGYLDEAERNRSAAASLGLVSSADFNGGHLIRVLGQRRVVMVFDPAAPDAGMLRTVVQLLRLAAKAADVRQDAAELDTVRERIAESLTTLTRFDGIKKLAGQIKANAAKMDTECESVQALLERGLGQAQVALAGAGVTPTAAAA